MQGPDHVAATQEERLAPKEVGREGERLACIYLQKHGYEIVETNWRCYGGEADIIYKDDGVHVLVEVKTRLARDPSEELIPELAVTERKQERYRRIALLYLAHKPGVESVRFDVMSVLLYGRGRGRVHHLMGAFVWDD